MNLLEIKYKSIDEVEASLRLIDQVLDLSKYSTIKPPNHMQLIEYYKHELLDTENQEYIDFWVMQSAEHDKLYRNIKSDLGI